MTSVVTICYIPPYCISFSPTPLPVILFQFWARLMTDFRRVPCLLVLFPASPLNPFSSHCQNNLSKLHIWPCHFPIYNLRCFHCLEDIMLFSLVNKTFCYLFCPVSFLTHLLALSVLLILNCWPLCPQHSPFPYSTAFISHAVSSSWKPIFLSLIPSLCLAESYYSFKIQV